MNGTLMSLDIGIVSVGALADSVLRSRRHVAGVWAGGVEAGSGLGRGCLAAFVIFASHLDPIGHRQQLYQCLHKGAG
jgi:hypothetical protein